MMYLKWLAFAPVSLAVNIFCLLTSPLWALVAAIGKMKTLPGWLAAVHTHDDWVYGFYAEKPEPPAKFFDRWKDACRWIARNPGYGFDAWVLGFEGPIEFEKGGEYIEFDTGQNVRRFDVMKTPNGKRYFSYRRDFALGGGRYVKLWIGWQTRTQAGWHICKVDLNPFKRVD